MPQIKRIGNILDGSDVEREGDRPWWWKRTLKFYDLDDAKSMNDWVGAFNAACEFFGWPRRQGQPVDPQIYALEGEFLKLLNGEALPAPPAQQTAHSK